MYGIDGERQPEDRPSPFVLLLSSYSQYEPKLCAIPREETVYVGWTSTLLGYPSDLTDNLGPGWSGTMGYCHRRGHWPDCGQWSGIDTRWVNSRHGLSYCPYIIWQCPASHGWSSSPQNVKKSGRYAPRVRSFLGATHPVRRSDFGVTHTLRYNQS
jgi:hypothetical protein